jgi:hypothetical protein
MKRGYMVVLGGALLAVGLVLGRAGPALASPPPGERLAVSIHAIGAPETVFRWSDHACGDTMIPDAPARAFRDADQKVRLIATSFEN